MGIEPQTKHAASNSRVQFHCVGAEPATLPSRSYDSNGCEVPSSASCAAMCAGDCIVRVLQHEPRPCRLSNAGGLPRLSVCITADTRSAVATRIERWVSSQALSAAHVKHTGCCACKSRSNVSETIYGGQQTHQQKQSFYS